MNVKPLLFILCAAFLYFTACKKNNDAPTVNTSIDSLNFINAYSIPFNIYLNGSRLNGNSNLTVQGSTGYYMVPSGIQIYQVKKVFDPSTSVVQTVFSFSPNLAPHHYYSLFVAGPTDSTAFVLQDNLVGDTTSGKCQVRVVNASPDAGSLDFSVGGVKYSNWSFGKGSAFMEVDTASLSPLIVVKSGTTDTLISGHYPLLQGYIYTIYSSGSVNGKGNSAFGVGVTVNAQ